MRPLPARSGLLVVVALLLAAALPASLPGPIGAQQDGVPAAADRAQVLNYWTEARMRAARPRDAVLAGAVGSSTRGADALAGSTPASSPWGGGGAIAARSGKIFFTLGGVDYVCSGSVIDDDGDPAYSLVLTAAHCVYDNVADVFATEWTYVPDFDAAPTYKCATVAYDCWGARALVVHAGYANEEDLTVAAAKHDYAVAVVGPGSGTGTQVDALGAYPVRIGSVPAGGSADVFGYPAASPFSGNDLIHCAGTVSVAAETGGWRMT